jgi:hypothetical protein
VKDRVPCHQVDHIKLTRGDEYSTQLRVQPINHQANNAEPNKRTLYFITCAINAIKNVLDKIEKPLLHSCLQ